MPNVYTYVSVVHTLAQNIVKVYDSNGRWMWWITLIFSFMFGWFRPKQTRSQTVWWCLFSRGWRTVMRGTEWALWLCSDTSSTHPVSFTPVIKCFIASSANRTLLSRLSGLFMQRFQCFADLVIFRPEGSCLCFASLSLHYGNQKASDSIQPQTTAGWPQQ